MSLKETSWLTKRRGIALSCGIALFLVLALFFAVASGSPDVCGEEAYFQMRHLESEDLFRLKNNMKSIGHFGGGIVHELFVRESDAFARFGNEVAQLDISHPDHPKRIGHYYFPAKVELVDIDAERPEAYVTLERRLWLVDFSDPRNPSLSNLYTAPNGIRNVKIEGDRAYLHVEYCDTSLSIRICGDGLHKVDISTREFVAAPIACYSGLLGDLAVEMAFLNLPTLFQRSASIGAHEFVAAGHDGIRVFERSILSGDVEVGHYDPPSSILKVLSLRQFAYLAEAEGNLYVVDISEPSNPTQVGVYKQSGNFTDLEHEDGSYLYAITNGGATFEILDVSTPSDPRFAGAMEASRTFLDVEVSQETAYLLEDKVGILVVELAQPEHPELLGIYRSEWIVDFAVQGNILYLLVSMSGLDELRVVDMSSPAAPEILSRTPLEDPRAVAMSENLVLVLAGDPDRLIVLNVSTPRDPLVVGELAVSSHPVGWVVEGHDVYLISDMRYISVLNASNPTQPAKIASFRLYDSTIERLADGGKISDIDVSEPYILVSDIKEGLFIVRLERAD